MNLTQYNHSNFSLDILEVLILSCTVSSDFILSGEQFYIDLL